MENLSKSACIVILLLLFLISSAEAVKQKTVLILWHELRWEDVKSPATAEFNELAVGLMNTRIGGGNAVNGAYLTISSGARALGVTDAAKMFYSSDNFQGNTAGEVYQLRTGQMISEENIVNPQIASILQATAQAEYPLQAGALAEKLQKAGIVVGVFGNSDLKDQAVRWAALVGMNSRGVVEYGVIGEELLDSNADYPYGVCTNYEFLLDAVVKSDVEFAIIDLGDPYRYSLYESLILSQQQPVIRERMVRQSWEFVQRLHNLLPLTDLIILSPYPGDNRAQNGQWLAPVLIIGQKEGLLQSATTRWPGIVANIDIAPTVLQAYGVDKGVMLGRSMEIQSMDSRQAVDYLIALEQKIFRVSKYRSPVLRFLVIFQIVIYLFTLALLIIPKPLNQKFIRLVQFILIFSLSTPLILLVVAKTRVIVLFVLIGLIYAYFSEKDPLLIIMVIGILTAGLISIDVVNGSWLMRFSYLGYDPLGGARFYGIGNEYMGILIGALIIGWSILRELRPKKPIGSTATALWDLGVFVLTAVIIAAPQWGTNVGGTITAVAGFGVTWLCLHKKQFKMGGVGSILLLGFIIVFSLGLLMYIDANRPETGQSHIGQTVSIIQQEGLSAVVQIIKRKLDMNIKLFKYSLWSRALIAAIIAMGASLIWPSRYLQWLLLNHPCLVKGIIGTLTATITALAVNDSGVVAAATCCSFAATAMLCTALGLKHNLLPS